MPAFLSYIIPPLIGGFIGYITNWLAIKMLFRPHTAKYVFGIHVPLTPGIIPKEKGRIAKSIGGVISENLMSHEVLEQYLLSDAMVGKLRTAVDGFWEKQRHNTETLSQFLGHYFSEEEIQTLFFNVTSSLTKQIHGKLTDTAIGDRVAHLAMEHVINNLSGDESDSLANSIIGLPGRFGKGVVAAVLAALQEPAERMLSRNINAIMQNNGDEIVSNLIGDELGKLLNTPIEQLLAGKEELLIKATNKVEALYRTAITEHLPHILETIDISKIVCDRINEMEVAEAEKLILQVMNKELKALVWLGAALGFLMGWVNVIIK